MNAPSRLVLAALLVCTMASGCRARDEARHVDGPHLGALMADVGRRFETIGRAALAHRWELAAFELGELEEDLEGLPNARVPEDVNAAALVGFKQGLPTQELAAALASKNPTTVATAYGHFAAVCNACHQATGRAFIEVPVEPGAAVPKLDPLP
jgi:hypothetical protein